MREGVQRSNQKGREMNRKELMTVIALATGISLTGGAPVGAGGLAPPIGDPEVFRPASGTQNFEPAGGEDPGGRGPFGGY